MSEQTKATNPITAPVLQYQEGQSVSTIYAVRSLGIDPSTGNEIFLTRDGQQTYRWSPLDEVPAGDNQPTVNGNLGTNFMYKGVSVNISMRTELGGQVYNRTLSDRVENADPVYNVDERVLTDRWQKPGDQARFKGLATIGGSTRTDITKASSRFIQDNNILYCDAHLTRLPVPETIDQQMAYEPLPVLLLYQQPSCGLFCKTGKRIGFSFRQELCLITATGFLTRKKELYESYY